MSTKRFIAGAVCPKCGVMDRLMTYENDEGRFKECVSCDFHEKQVLEVAPEELQTRVNQFEAEKEQVDAVKILIPGKKN